MARHTDRRTRRTASASSRRSTQKPCALCRDKVEWVDYKDVNLLRRHLSDRGKIRARRVTGNCAWHQGEIAVAIKTARELVLLPYSQRTSTERPGRRDRGRRGASSGSEAPRVDAVDVDAEETADMAVSDSSRLREMAGVSGSGRP